jgi:hypothetical protein
LKSVLEINEINHPVSWIKGQILEK